MTASTSALGLAEHLLDARRVDAAVGDQLLEREAGDLAAHAVEAREHDRLGRVVDDEVDAGDLLEGADVATLAADDAALHVVAGQVDDRDGRLGDVVGRRALDAEREDVARPPVGFAPGLFLDGAHHLGHVVAHSSSVCFRSISLACGRVMPEMRSSAAQLLGVRRPATPR